MDINDKVSVCVCVRVWSICWSIKGLSALRERAIAHVHGILMQPEQTVLHTHTQFCLIHFMKKMYCTTRSYSLSSTVACAHFSPCAHVLCVLVELGAIKTPVCTPRQNSGKINTSLAHAAKDTHKKTYTSLRSNYQEADSIP